MPTEYNPNLPSLEDYLKFIHGNLGHPTIPSGGTSMSHAAGGGLPMISGGGNENKRRSPPLESSVGPADLGNMPTGTQFTETLSSPKTSGKSYRTGSRKYTMKTQKNAMNQAEVVAQKIDAEKYAIEGQIGYDAPETRSRRGADYDKEAIIGEGYIPSDKLTEETGIYLDPETGAFTNRGSALKKPAREKEYLDYYPEEEIRQDDALRKRYGELQKYGDTVNYFRAFGQMPPQPQRPSKIIQTDRGDYLQGPEGKLTKGQPVTKPQKKGKSNMEIAATLAAKHAETTGIGKADMKELTKYYLKALNSGQLPEDLEGGDGAGVGTGSKQAGSKYSADDIKAAYKAGKISKKRAIEILKKQFGMK